MKQNARHRSALITGASSGLGRGLAKRVALQGIPVVVVARRAEALEELVAEIQATGGKAWAFKADVSKAAEARAAVAFAVNQMGSLDLLICNAGISMPMSLKKIQPEWVQEVMGINFLGTTNFIASAVPHMIREQRGQIVTVSSMAAFGAFPQNGAYCASKSALNVFMKSIEAEANGFGITTTTICPGFIETAMTAKNKYPMPFLMKEDKAVDLMWDAIAAGRKFFVFPWQMRVLSAVFAKVPQWFMFKMMKRSTGNN